MKIRNLLAISATFLAFAFAVQVQAATSVTWLSPPDGSSYPTGTAVAPTGQASGVGTVGAGLDLALVLDSSGSMGGSRTVGGVTKTLQQWQKDAAIALVNSLPTATTSVSIIQFDSSASVYRQLTALEPASNKASIIAAINAVDASGGTYIGSGIRVATLELTSARHTAGRAQMMVVMSDGQTSNLTQTYQYADQAGAAGIAVHTVGLPGHSASTMRGIADGVDNIVGTADDNGIYTDATNLQTLIDIFGGTGGNLVGLDRVEITMPDGTVIASVGIDALGNFTAPLFNLLTGANTYTATAYGTDGTMASASLTLHGVDNGGGTQVAEPGSLALLGLGLLGVVGTRRKMTK